MPSVGSKGAAKRSSWRAKNAVVDQDDPERRQLLAAAKDVLERSGWWGFKIDSVLRQARLSTRSFYRHFDKKNDLLLALLERELGGATVKLRRVTAAADSPSARIHAYVAATIDMAYEAELAKPSSLFASHWRELLPEYGDEIGRIIDEMMAPLVDAIADGVRSGDLVSDDPKADAAAVFYLVAGMTADQAVAGRTKPREDIEHIVLPFIDRAMGLR